MSAALPPDLAGLRRASRVAGLLTLAGAVVVLAAIGYSVWRLGETEARLADERAQVADLRAEVAGLGGRRAELDRAVAALRDQEAALRKEHQLLVAQRDQAARELAALRGQVQAIAASIPPPPSTPLKVKPPPIAQIKEAVEERGELENQVTVLRKEAALIREKLRQSFADPRENLKLWGQPEYRGVMTAVLVEPTSRYISRPDPDPNSPTGVMYHFTLSLRFPGDPALAAAMKRDIRSVTYEMNHPYRKVPPLVSRDPASDFEVKYDGAGTLRNVVVKIEVAGAGVVALDYDMTRAHPEAKKK